MSLPDRISTKGRALTVDLLSSGTADSARTQSLRAITKFACRVARKWDANLRFSLTVAARLGL